MHTLSIPRCSINNSRSQETRTPALEAFWQRRPLRPLCWAAAGGSTGGQCSTACLKPGWRRDTARSPGIRDEPGPWRGRCSSGRRHRVSLRGSGGAPAAPGPGGSRAGTQTGNATGTGAQHRLPRSLLPSRCAGEAAHRFLPGQAAHKAFPVRGTLHCASPTSVRSSALLLRPSQPCPAVLRAGQDGNCPMASPATPQHLLAVTSFGVTSANPSHLIFHWGFKYVFRWLEPLNT